ncbi:hypothetical protein GCM10027187_40520 [Streptosporangium sandarakinum]
MSLGLALAGARGATLTNEPATHHGVNTPIYDALVAELADQERTPHGRAAEPRPWFTPAVAPGRADVLDTTPAGVIA